jgi:tetratricopeptide (TPR) repeat protein
METKRKKYTPDMQSFDAALWNYYFHMNFSKETYLTTRQELEKSIQHDPNIALALAMLAELYIDAHSLGYPTVSDPVNESYQLVQKAVRIDPQCQHAHLIYGWVSNYMKKKKDAIQAFEKCLELNPSSVSMIGSVGFGMACVGEYKRAHALLTQSINLNPHCPWWYSLGFFLVYYQNRQYREALEHANKIDAPDVYLNYLTKAAAKGQLGLIDEACAEIEILSTSFSQILENLKTYLGFFTMDEVLIDDIIKGAKKAGLTIA